MDCEEAVNELSDRMLAEIRAERTECAEGRCSEAPIPEEWRHDKSDCFNLSLSHSADLLAEVDRLRALVDRARTIADEANGPHEVIDGEEALTRIEKALFDGRAALQESEADRERANTALGLRAAATGTLALERDAAIAALRALYDAQARCSAYRAECTKAAVWCCYDATSDLVMTCDEHKFTGGMCDDEEPRAVRWADALSAAGRVLDAAKEGATK